MHRPAVPLHRDLARADAVLHRRGGLAARAIASDDASVHLRAVPARCRRPGATTRSPRNGARCATCAASSPARSRSSAPASASAPRSRPIRSCTSSNPELFEALVDVDLAEVCITSAATLVERRRPGRRVPAAGRAGRRGRRQPRRRPQVRALVENLRTPSAADPQYPDVTPRDAQALREWETMRKAAE